MKTSKLSLISFLTMSLTTVMAQAQDEEEAQLVSTQLAVSKEVKPVMWLPGNVISRLDSAISAEQTGQLLSIVDIGSQVEKGAVIAELDDRETKLQLAQLKAQQRQLQANLEYLKKQQVRMDKLAENFSTSVSEIDRNRRDLQVAKEQLKAMALQIQSTELSLEKAQIKAPFTGTVNAHFVSLGELISVNTAVLQLVDTEHLDIQVAAPLNLSDFVTRAQGAQVKWAGELITLPIRTWSSSGAQASRTFDLRLDATGLELFAGSAVQVSLPKSAEVMAVTIPRDGLILRAKESFVFTVDEGQTAHKVNVQIGQGIDDWVVVNGDLDAGDQVITRGGERLQDGQTVRVNNAVVESNKLSALEGLADAG